MLVVGASGVFGSRLVEGVLRTTDFHVVAAARDPSSIVATGRVTPLAFNARQATAAGLRATGAFAVMDAAGPFQRGSYVLARAAIAAGLHYVDIADARDFIAGFPALDAGARAAGVAALTGASSTPALSGAALAHLTAGWRRIDTVEIAISPGNRAPRGLSVVQAILSYAGRPIRVFHAGAWGERPGWGMTVRRVLPGLGPRWLGLCETADLDLVPARFAVRHAVIFRAGLELLPLHLGLLAASLPVRWGVLPSLRPLAGAFRRIAGWFERFGTDRGGMLVAATGRDAAGAPVRAEWSLVAEAGDGPVIPTLPALAALRALAGAPVAGARACALPLDRIAGEFAPYRITTQERIAHPPSLFQSVLGAGFAALPAPLRELHMPGPSLRARGRAQVDGAETWPARVVARLLGLPPGGRDVPVSVRIEASAGRERWERDFGGRRFRSTLSAARDGLVERFGPLGFRLAVESDRTGIRGMKVVGWRLGPLPLPRRLAPVSVAREDVDPEGRFRFDVALDLPLGLGRIVRYRGWLVPEA